MALKLIQRGNGAARVLVAGFGPFIAGTLPADLGPDPCIVFDADGHGTEPIAEVIDFAHRQAGFSSVAALALIGFSIGCSRVRRLRQSGAQAGAYLLCDGTHASLPPQAGQIEWLHELADQAREGRILLVASHTLQTYVEQLRPPERPYLATVNVLRRATGLPLELAGSWHQPIRTRSPILGPPSSGLWIYSYATAPADYAGHVFQGGPALHQLAGAHLAPWLGAPAHGPLEVSGPSSGSSVPSASSGSSAPSASSPGGAVVAALGVAAWLLLSGKT